MTERIGWHADSYDPKLASIRFRLLAPMAALAEAGLPIELYDPTRGPGAYRTVVFSKSQSADAVEIARALKASGGRMVYDLCDNLFAAHAAGHASAARIARVRTMLALADALTFSTAALRDQIVAAVDGLTPDRWVVPDVIQLDRPTRSATTPEQRALDRLRAFLGRHPDALHCVWFGKSLGRVSGYVHLSRAAAALARLPFPATLTVISNDRLRYWAASRRWRLPRHYMPWRLATASPALQLHEAAVIPVEANDYTLGKTMNRPAIALLAGLGVVADPLPSYEELRPFLHLDDWEDGLAAIRRRDPAALARIANGQAFLTERYSAAAIADRWAEVLASIAA